MNDETLYQLGDLLLKGNSYRQTATKLGVDKETVRKYAKKFFPELAASRTKVPLSEAKILVVDIETRPALAYVWGVWQQNIGPHQIVEDKAMISWAAKWHDSSAVFYNDNRSPDWLKNLWDLFDAADVIVHYNGYSFDVPHIQQEFLLANMSPPSGFHQIDLLKTMRTEFNFTSNKLDNIATQLGIGHKVEHEGFALWVKCMAGDDAAWDRMRKYNIQDVRLTDQLFTRTMLWLKSPNLPKKRLLESKFWRDNAQV
jgi:DNA polymerase elongation subunit (family B)